MKFCMKVWGCQMNVYDSDRVRAALTRFADWDEAEREDDADLVIITGCSVRAKAEQKVWSEIGRYEASWRKDRRPTVALAGCVAQSLGKRALSRFPWVRLVSGPRHIGLLPDALRRVMEEPKARLDLLDTDPREFFELEDAAGKREGGTPGDAASNPKAYVTIAYGCDNFCTYCIVPYVRGRFLSRPKEAILREVRSLAGAGVKEITLLGQNVNSYGKDLPGNNDLPTFASLLRDVARVEGVKRVRFVTSLPQDFTRDIVEVMASEPAVCPSLNLPVQAGSDRILKLMNRKYTLAEYKEKVGMARSALPELGLTTDLIVGFPGETEEDFQASLDALEEIRFDLVHSAAYSEREGTPAATMPGALPQEVRLERLTRLNGLQDGITLSLNKELVGRTVPVLVDGPAPKGEGLLQGRTPTDKVVLFAGEKSLIGQFADIRVTEAESWCLHGEMAGAGS